MNDMFTQWYGFHIRPEHEGYYQARNYVTGWCFWVLFKPDDTLWSYILRFDDPVEWRGLSRDPGSLSSWYFHD